MIQRRFFCVVRHVSRVLLLPLATAALWGCHQAYPKSFRGPLAAVADSIFSDHPRLDCLNWFNIGLPLACRATVADTEVYFYADSTERVTVVGRLFTRDREAAKTTWSRLVRESTARYGPGARCSAHGKMFNDVRWSFGDRTLIVDLHYNSSPGTDAGNLGAIGIVWAAGTPSCAQSFGPPRRA